MSNAKLQLLKLAVLGLVSCLFLPGIEIDQARAGEEDNTGAIIRSDASAQNNRFEAIRLTEIKSASLSSVRIDGSNNTSNKIPDGTIILYKTNEGRYGKLLIKKYGRSLRMKWTTYNSQGRVHRRGNDLVVRSSYSCDLDAGKESRASGDFWWHHITSVERFFTPQNGAQFAVAKAFAVKREALTGEEFVTILKTLYDVATKAKSFYDEHLSNQLSAEEKRFLTLVEEVNVTYLKEILGDAWTAIDLFSGATSIDESAEDYKEWLYADLSHVKQSGMNARNLLHREITDPERPPRYTVMVLETHALLIPILAAAGRGTGWSEERVKELIWEDAIVANESLLGSRSTNHACLPFYFPSGGKLKRAYDKGDISLDEYKRLRVIIWNSQELAKKASGIKYKHGFWIRSDVRRKDKHIYNQCLTRSGSEVIAEDGMLSDARQMWSFEPTEEGLIRLTFWGRCLTRSSLYPFGPRLYMEKCTDGLRNQLWEWIGHNIVTPAEADTVDERRFLYIRSDGSLTLKRSSLEGKTGDFPSFRVLHPDEPLDNRTNRVGYRGGRTGRYESQTFRCPLGTAVQGVIGSGKGRLANFGLICAPLRSGWRRRPTLEEQLASATVISYGTTAVGGYTTSPEGDPFWYYYDGMNSGRLTGGEPVRHDYVMSPHGYFVNSIKIHSSPGGIWGLESMICVRRDSALGINLPDDSFGACLPQFDQGEARCPTHDSFYTGMTVFRSAGPYIGSFEGDSFASVKLTTDLVGDKDGFGLGLREAGRRPTSAGAFDERGPSDPLFTDVMPAPTPKFSYTHQFNLAGRGAIERAQITLLTLGIQDGDTQVTGSDTDIRLYVDDVEVQQAFDKVDQFSSKNSVWGQSAGQVYVELPEAALDSLKDGKAKVTIETVQLGSGGLDTFAVDYAELLIATTR